MYDYDSVYTATLAYFGGNELATNVWVGKYALRNPDGMFLELTPEDMHKRLAREFDKIEQGYTHFTNEATSDYGKRRKKLDYSRIYDLFKDFKNIIPQGSVMALAGDVHYVGSLSNCFVVPSPYDSYGGILHTDQQITQLVKRRGGIGFDISTLRPSGTPVKNAAQTSTGTTSFMHRFSNTTREVALNGRRGALMLTIDCRHPDILEFINIKQDKLKVTGANVSIMWTDDFMAAVNSDSEYTLRWPVDVPLTEAKVTKPVRAKAIWDAAVKAAHNSAEPGVAFKDRIKNYSTCDPYAPIVSSNPCGEIFMAKNESCRLIASNMFGAVRNPYTPNAYFDFDYWYEICYEATVLSDDLVDLELLHAQRIIDKIKVDPEPEFIKSTELKTWEDLYTSGKKGRRIGAGFTALGDTLAALNLKYDESLATIEQIALTKFKAEWDATTDLAIERGAMPLWYEQGFLPTEFTAFLADIHPDAHKRMLQYGRRNISVSTVAPTGSLSILAKLVTEHGTTAGIEPLFAPWYTRRRKVNADAEKVDFVDATGDHWLEFKVYHNGLLEWAKINGIADIVADYDKSPYYKACAPDIDWEQRVAIQGLVQKFVTHSISSTVNLPKTATIADVDKIYRTAYTKGLKGITVYVDGSRDGVLITTPTTPKIAKNDAPKRPARLDCKIFNTIVKGEYWVVLIGMLNDEPYEVFAYPNGRINYREGIILKRGKGVYDLEVNGKVLHNDIASLYVNDEQAAATRLISTALRHGTDAIFVIEQLEKSGGTIVDFSKAIARALKKMLVVTPRKATDCPDCGSELVSESGCLTCKNCGYSKCG